MSISYRSYRRDDAAALVAIMRQAISDVAARFYAPDQIAAWAARLPGPQRLNEKYTDGRFVLLAVTEDGAPIAFGDLMVSGYIDYLYCRPDFAGQGIVSKLYDGLEAEARRQGHNLITVDASEAARPLFEHKGFAVVRRNDLVLGGVAIHNYRMEKQLG